jgi:anti-anti-sigma regulatory factor
VAADGRLASGSEFLIVDMSAVGCVDCAAVGALLRARQAAALDGGDVVLVGPHGYAARILDLQAAPATGPA